jgi:acyl-coenzyme A synthetase/AMP-(fatty) acid ligase
MIKVKGHQVAPAELEDLLLGHTKVEDCAVLGVPDDYSGEVPKAFIVLKSGVQKDQNSGKELLKYVKEKKIRYKWIKEIEFVDMIPKSASGKILRKELRNKAVSSEKGLIVKDGVSERSML